MTATVTVTVYATVGRSRARSRGIAIAVLCLFPAGATAAEYWTFEEDTAASRSAARVRFSTRAALWFSNFDRPPRACDLVATPIAFPGGVGAPFVPNRGLRATQVEEGEGSFCPSDDSDELGIATGVEVSFRVTGPIHVTAALDLVYTTPQFDTLKNQLVIAVPFGLLFTTYAWLLRPIAQVSITPVLYLTDDARDYTLGAGLGAAHRLLEFGDLSLVVGYQSARSLESWTLQIGLHPLP